MWSSTFLDADGRPSFNALQNYASAGAQLHFYVFDLLVLGGHQVMEEPLMRRRELLEEQVLPRLSEPIRYSPALEATLRDLIASVKAQGLEGLVAKRRNSKYEPGERSGAWQKMRVNQGQEFVIGGYTPAPKNFDPSSHRVLRGEQTDVRRTHPERLHAGITRGVVQKVKPQEINECPFGNLPEKKAGRWGAGLTAAKMAECRWAKPVLVGQFEFVEWAEDGHLRHSRFIGLREDKKAKDVRRE